MKKREDEWNLFNCGKILQVENKNPFRHDIMKDKTKKKEPNYGEYQRKELTR